MIKIDADLQLSTKKAEQELKKLTSSIEPVVFDISTKNLDRELKVLTQSIKKNNILIETQINLDQIKAYSEELAAIKQQSQIAVAPKINFASIQQLQTEISKVKQESLINITPTVNSSAFALFDRKISQLKDTANFGVSANNNIVNSNELINVAQKQVILLEGIKAEANQTQKTIKQESAVSFQNFLKSKFQENIFTTAKQVVFETFNLDPKLFEKFLRQVLPSTQIIGKDINKLVNKIRDITGASGLLERTLNNFANELTDASVAANSMEEFWKNIREGTKKPIADFKKDLASIREKSTPSNIRSELGINSQIDLVKALLGTTTVQSTARGLARASAAPLAARKDAIQNERLGAVIARAEQLLTEPVTPSKEKPRNLANQYKNALGAVNEMTDELLLVIGGHTKTINNGIHAANDLNKAFEELNQLQRKRAVGIKNPETAIGASGSPLMPALSVARPNIRGFSKDAEEMAAQAIAAMVKNPNIKVTLVGESGGGLRVEEAVQILNKLGYGARVQGIGLGTPEFKAKASRPENFTALLGINEQEEIGEFVKEKLFPLGIIDPNVTKANPKVTQSMKGIESHSLDAYLETAEAQAAIFGEEMVGALGGKSQVKAKEKDIKKLGDRLIEKLRFGLIKEAQKELKKFEDTIRITGAQEQLFQELKAQMELALKDQKKGSLGAVKAVADYVQTFSAAVPKAEKMKDKQFFADIQNKIPKLELQLAKASQGSSKITQAIIVQTLKDLDELNKTAARSLIKIEETAKTEIAKVEGESSPESLKTAIIKYKDKIIAFRKNIEQKALQGNISQPEIEAGLQLARQGETLAQALKQQRGFSEQSRSLLGVSGTLKKKAQGLRQESVQVGEEIVSGILQGTNQDVAQILNQGQILGKNILVGFKKELGIKSPSTVFIKQMLNVSKGIVEGTKQTLNVVRQQGAILGTEVSQGFRQKIETIAQERKNDLFWLVQFQSKKANKFLQQQQSRRVDNQRRINLNVNELKRYLQLRKDLAKIEQVVPESALRETDRQIEAKINVTQKRIAQLKEEKKAYRQQEAQLKKITELNRQLQRAIAAQDTKKVRTLSQEIGNINKKLRVGLPPRFGENLGGIERQLERIRKTASNTLKALIGFGILNVSSRLRFGLQQLAADAIKTQVRFEQLETSMNFIAGSAAEGAKALDTARKEAARLKVNLEVALRGYNLLAAASKDSPLEAETTRMFRVINQAARVYGLSAQNLEGIYRALQQSISGGTLQLEEIRQLGESGGIPGAFRIVAEGIGVTQKELKQLVKTGQVFTEDVLPDIITRLDEVTRSGVAAATQTTGAAIEGLRTEWIEFRVELGKEIKPAAVAGLNALTEVIKFSQDNLEIVNPLLRATTALILTLFLPSLITLSKFIKAGLIKGLNILVGTVTGNVKGLSLLAKTARVASAALKTMLILEGISQLIGLFVKLENQNIEAKNAVEQLSQTYIDFREEILNNRENDKNLAIFDFDILRDNIQKAEDDLSGFQRFLDRVNNAIINSELQKIGVQARTFEEAVVEDLEEKAIRGIAQANVNLSQIPLLIGTELEEIDTTELKRAASTIQATIDNLRLLSPTTQETLDLQREAIARQEDALSGYNQELDRRKELSLNLSKIEIERSSTINQAQQLESSAIDEINQQILNSGDLKQKNEAEKLAITQNRLKAELDAEKKALAEILSLQTEQGFDDNNLPLGLSEQELKQYKKSRDRIRTLESELVNNLISLAEKQKQERLAIYDSQIQEIEKRAKKANETATNREQQRNLAIQQLVNDNVLTNEEAENLKAKAARDRIDAEIAAEKTKLKQLNSTIETDKELRAKQVEEIDKARSKIIKLTITSLQQEQQLEEKAVNAMIKARQDYYSEIESGLNRIEQIQQQQSQLESDFASALIQREDLNLSSLNRALEIRRKLNEENITPNQRKDLIRELNRLNIDGKTNELSLLKNIENKEKEIIELKRKAIIDEQKRQQDSLLIEERKLEIAAMRAKFEAENRVIEAEKEVVSTETAIAEATNQEELDRASKLNDLARKSLDLAKEELNLSNEQLDNLDSVIDKKRENLKIALENQKAEFEATTGESLSQAEKRRTEIISEKNQRTGKVSDRDLTLQERVDRKIKNQELSDDAQLRKNLIKQERLKTRNQSNFRFISAPSDISIPPIPVTVPGIEQNTQSNISNNLVLQTLKSINSNLEKKQPSVTNNNNFVNKFERPDNKKILGQVRGEILDIFSNLNVSML